MNDRIPEEIQHESIGDLIKRIWPGSEPFPFSYKLKIGEVAEEYSRQKIASLQSELSQAREELDSIKSDRDRLHNMVDECAQAFANTKEELERMRGEKGMHWVNGGRRLPAKMFGTIARFAHNKSILYDFIEFVRNNPDKLSVIEWLDEAPESSLREERDAYRKALEGVLKWLPIRSSGHTSIEMILNKYPQ
jgi:hypothetical protein